MCDIRPGNGPVNSPDSKTRRLTVLSTAGHSMRDKKDILRFAFVALDSPHSHFAVLCPQTKQLGKCRSLPISWTNNTHDRSPVSPFAWTSLDSVCIECGPKDPCFSSVKRSLPPNLYFIDKSRY